MAKINMKLSKGQYQALLARMTEREASPTTQSSMAQNGMDPEMMGGPGGMVPSPTPTPGAPQMPQMPQMGALPGQAPPPELPQPDPSGMGALQQPGDLTTQAVQTWQKLKGGIGEQLWSRLAQTAADAKGARSPEGFFVQEAMKYMTNPASVTDERVRRFLEGVLGAAQPSGGDTMSTIQSLIQ